MEHPNPYDLSKCNWRRYCKIEVSESFRERRPYDLSKQHGIHVKVSVPKGIGIIRKENK